ncbi:hypothetical protein BN946_scf184939.g69 [Trametes cinnabarina]|uniref:Uncharacterized protein n=1 Tax=Pycnoporus cinnabarinus TaxID=5643 RepID=A0A060SBY0_PYCCI|nr:hypothetical protein BN946_scf184939.g69 [Trametes cinnabarina]
MHQSKNKENRQEPTKTTGSRNSKGKSKLDKVPAPAKTHAQSSASRVANSTTSKDRQPRKRQASTGQSRTKPKKAQISADDLQAEIAALTAQIKEEKAARKQLETEMSKMKKHTKTLRRIPKPRGTVGRGLKLRKEMKLSDNKILYLACLMTVRDLCLAGRLDWKKGIREQSPTALGALYEVAREEQPYLKRFENDWATAQILIQFMANRRKNAIKNGRVIVAYDAEGRRYLQDVKVVPQVSADAADGQGAEIDAAQDDLDEGFGDGEDEDLFEEQDPEYEEREENHGQVQDEEEEEDQDQGQQVDEDEEEEADNDDEDDDNDNDADDDAAHAGTRSQRANRSHINSSSAQNDLSDDDEPLQLPAAKRRKLGTVVALLA